MSSKITKAILRLTPSAQFVVHGTAENYELEWHSDDVPQPSAEEIAGSIAALDRLAYQEARAAEYPSFAAQFDLLYHGGYDAWKAAVDAVKAKHPKPTE